eukprot:COSAG02_NODE_915_length_15986_cov_16.498584_6_plen_73_part_00
MEGEGTAGRCCCRVEMSQPTVKWAQRKDRLFLTVDIQDIADEKVALTADKVIITGKVRSESESGRERPVLVQ